MVIVKLQGGLGNQMFQYAAARASSGGKVYLDLSFLEKNSSSTDTFTAREYQLAVFQNINAKVSNRLILKLYKSDKKMARIIRAVLLPSFTRISDESQVPKKQSGGILYFDGYFQSGDYFETIRNTLIEELKFPPFESNMMPWVKKIKNSIVPISVHVRRGDYIKPAIASVHGVLPVRYYQEAMNIINAKVEHPEYFIFSDDINWCRNNLAFANMKINFVSSSEMAWADMALMSRCQHHIIANSSFSWWAAWLNTTDEKIVIAPRQWFADCGALNTAINIIPDKWIKI